MKPPTRQRILPVNRPRYKPVSKCLTVAELLADPKRWVQRRVAINTKGYDCFPRDEDAIAWCMNGAVARFYDSGTEAFDEARKRILRITGTSAIHPWNDAPKRTHAEVLAIARKAGI